MEALVDRLKTFRQGDPLTCQRIWDVIKQIRVNRKAANRENIVRIFSNKFKIEVDSLCEQLEFLVEDKLIIKKASSIVKGSNKGVEQIVYSIPVSFYHHIACLCVLALNRNFHFFNSLNQRLMCK